MRHVLVTGAGGQLGTELQRCAWPEGWQVTALDMADLDLRDTAAIAAMVASRPWAVVINGAAYTAVDKAETDLVTAWAVNAMAPAAFAQGCAAANIPLVQVSTDYVFAGDKAGAWEVDDPVGPLGVYGASKLGGELAVRTSGARAAIVRTAWVVSAHGNNFVKTMLRFGKEREEMRVVADQHGSPTAAADLAAAIVQIAQTIEKTGSAAWGTYHLTGSGYTTWHDFAEHIFRRLEERTGKRPRLTAIGTVDYPTPARRPTNSRLDCGRAKERLGVACPPWQESVDRVIDELFTNPPQA